VPNPLLLLSLNQRSNKKLQHLLLLQRLLLRVLSARSSNNSSSSSKLFPRHLNKPPYPTTQSQHLFPNPLHRSRIPLHMWLPLILLSNNLFPSKLRTSNHPPSRTSIKLSSHSSPQTFISNHNTRHNTFNISLNNFNKTILHITLILNTVYLLILILHNLLKLPFNNSPSQTLRTPTISASRKLLLRYLTSTRPRPLPPRPKITHMAPFRSWVDKTNINKRPTWEGLHLPTMGITKTPG